MNIQIIGAGKLGTSLMRALQGSGYRVSYIWDVKKKAAKSFAKYLSPAKFRLFGDLQELAIAGLIIICVPDSRIRRVADSIFAAKLSLNNTIVLHTSGALDKHELAPLQKMGARTGSLHPLQTFNRLFLPPSVFKNIYFACEGTGKVYSLAAEIVSALEGKIFPIRSDQKILYHIVAVAASNFLIGLMHYSENLFSGLNVEKKTAKEILLPLISRSIQNYRHTGSLNALTGPLQRRDFRTVKIHLAYLKKYHPQLYQLYLEFSKYIYSFIVDNDKLQSQLMQEIEKS